MKRHLLCGLLAAALVLSLSGCGGRSDPGNADKSNAVSAGSQSAQDSKPAGEAKGYFFLAGDTTVAVNDNMADVLGSLGEPKSYFEAESCAFEGLDKTYTYSGFEITTRPEGDQDFVNSIWFTDDSVTTPEGLYLGAGRDDVIAAYGESSGATDALLSYVKGGTVLNFVLADGKVVSIEYLTN